jgi:hypothetical protein
MGYGQQDGHTGLSNQPCSDEIERAGIRFQLAYLKTSDHDASFVIHADPRFGTLSGSLQPEGVLERLGFRPFQSCNVLGGSCHYLYFAQARLDAWQRGDILANQPIHDAYRRFTEHFPDLVKTMMDVDFKLRMAGFDIFPWEGAAMKPWDISSGPKEVFVPPAHEHEAYVKIRDIVKEATQSLLIADPYVDATLFELLSNVQPGVDIRVLTRNVPTDFALELKKFRNDGGNIEVRGDSTLLHDRFILRDAACYHLGASIKDAGLKGFVISLMEDPTVVQAVRSVVENAWNAGTHL